MLKVTAERGKNSPREFLVFDTLERNFDTLEQKFDTLEQHFGTLEQSSYNFFVRMDKLHMALTELCFAINHSSGIQVWEHTFAPREYLAQHLETRFNKSLLGMVMYSSDTQDIAKPSELLNSVKAYMNVLQTIENYGEYQFCPQVLIVSILSTNSDRLYQQ